MKTLNIANFQSSVVYTLPKDIYVYGIQYVGNLSPDTAAYIWVGLFDLFGQKDRTPSFGETPLVMGIHMIRDITATKATLSEQPQTILPVPVRVLNGVIFGIHTGFSSDPYINVFYAKGSGKHKEETW